MEGSRNLYQSTDWRADKHMPVINAPEFVKRGQPFEINVSIGKDAPHPNNTEHHIRWIEVYFHPEGEKFPFQIGTTGFADHEELLEERVLNSNTINPKVSLTLKTDKPGIIFSFGYCNIHGLWQNSKTINVE